VIEDKIYPKKLKYKGCTIIQEDGEVTVYNGETKVLIIHTQREKSIRELRDLFEFNNRLYEFYKGGG
jgi:hypothetical protein